MQLHQINVAYDAEQDRLLVSMSTVERVEYKLWLTRRIVRGLWQGLVQLMASSELARSQAAPEARRAVVEFQHEQALREARFSDRYENGQLQPALPGDPLLVVRIRLQGAGAGRHQLSFLPKSGQGFNVQLTDSLLHAFARLLHDAMNATEWDLGLALPAATPAQAGLKPN